MYSNDVSFLNLSKQYFTKLLEFAVKDVLFIFNNILYCQIDGIGMGNPLGPTLANIFLCHHEVNWLNECPQRFKPLFYKRYIDYTFLLFSDPIHVQEYFNYLNL